MAALAAVASAVAASAAMRALFRASIVPLPFFFRLSAVPAGGEGAASGIGGCVGVDVERVGGAIVLPCEVGDDGAGAHGVNPELVRFPDDDVLILEWCCLYQRNLAEVSQRVSFSQKSEL